MQFDVCLSTEKNSEKRRFVRLKHQTPSWSYSDLSLLMAYSRFIVTYSQSSSAAALLTFQKCSKKMIFCDGASDEARQTFVFTLHELGKLWSSKNFFQKKHTHKLRKTRIFLSRPSFSSNPGLPVFFLDVFLYYHVFPQAPRISWEAWHCGGPHILRSKWFARGQEMFRGCTAVYMDDMKTLPIEWDVIHDWILFAPCFQITGQPMLAPSSRLSPFGSTPRPAKRMVNPGMSCFSSNDELLQSSHEVENKNIQKNRLLVVSLFKKKTTRVIPKAPSPTSPMKRAREDELQDGVGVASWVVLHKKPLLGQSLHLEKPIQTHCKCNGPRRKVALETKRCLWTHGRLKRSKMLQSILLGHKTPFRIGPGNGRVKGHVWCWCFERLKKFETKKLGASSREDRENQPKLPTKDIQRAGPPPKTLSTSLHQTRTFPKPSSCSNPGGPSGHWMRQRLGCAERTLDLLPKNGLDAHSLAKHFKQFICLPD